MPGLFPEQAGQDTVRKQRVSVQPETSRGQWRSKLDFAPPRAPLTPTIIGRMTMFAIRVVLLVLVFKLLLPTNLSPSLWIEWSLRSLYFLIGANILYLFYRGVAWADFWKNHR